MFAPEMLRFGTLIRLISIALNFFGNMKRSPCWIYTKNKKSRDFVASYRKSSSARQKIYKQSWVIIKAEFFFVFTPQLYPYFCVYANFGALLPHLFFIPCMMKNSSFIFWWEIFSAYTVLLFYVDFWVNNWCFSLLGCISARKFTLSLAQNSVNIHNINRPIGWQFI